MQLLFGSINATSRTSHYHNFGVSRRLCRYSILALIVEGSNLDVEWIISFFVPLFLLNARRIDRNLLTA